MTRDPKTQIKKSRPTFEQFFYIFYIFFDWLHFSQIATMESKKRSQLRKKEDKAEALNDRCWLVGVHLKLVNILIKFLVASQLTFLFRLRCQCDRKSRPNTSNFHPK